MSMTRRTWLALASFWPFGRLAVAQPEPSKRPRYVVEPKIGEHYWTVRQPFQGQRRRPVKLPWRGVWQEGVWGEELAVPGDRLVAIKAAPYDLFRTRAEAEAAIVWDWNHPPADKRNL